MTILKFDLVEALRARFFAKDRDVVLQSGRKIAVTSANIEISNGNLTITTGNIVITGTVDGINIADHAADTDAHHTEAHTLASHTGQLDHGSDLTGLSDDDHSQYHNDTRGDARYFQQSEFSSNTGASSKPLETDSSGLVRPRGVGANTAPVDGEVRAAGDIVAVGGDVIALTDGKFGGGIVAGTTSQNPATGAILLPDISSPGTPPSGFGYLYVDTNNDLVYRDEDGNAWALNTL